MEWMSGDTGYSPNLTSVSSMRHNVSLIMCRLWSSRCLGHSPRWNGPQPGWPSLLGMREWYWWKGIMGTHLSGLMLNLHNQPRAGNLRRTQGKVSESLIRLLWCARDEIHVFLRVWELCSHVGLWANHLFGLVFKWQGLSSFEYGEVNGQKRT